MAPQAATSPWRLPAPALPPSMAPLLHPLHGVQQQQSPSSLYSCAIACPSTSTKCSKVCLNRAAMVCPSISPCASCYRCCPQGVCENAAVRSCSTKSSLASSYSSGAAARRTSCAQVTPLLHTKFSMSCPKTSTSSGTANQDVLGVHQLFDHIPLR